MTGTRKHKSKRRGGGDHSKYVEVPLTQEGLPSRTYHYDVKHDATYYLSKNKKDYIKCVFSVYDSGFICDDEFVLHFHRTHDYLGEHIDGEYRVYTKTSGSKSKSKSKSKKPKSPRGVRI